MSTDKLISALRQEQCSTPKGKGEVIPLLEKHLYSGACILVRAKMLLNIVPGATIALFIIRRKGGGGTGSSERLREKKVDAC